MTPAPDSPFVDLDQIDEACAMHYGLTPLDVDRLSLRDVAVMMRGARSREREAWRHTAYTIQAIINYGGPRAARFQPRPLDDLHHRMFGRPAAVTPMDPADVARRLGAVSTRAKE